jgi:hypothetical protein
MSGHQDAINLYDQSLAADPEHHYTSVIAWMGRAQDCGIKPRESLPCEAWPLAG